jgi:hypothetical protein
VPLQILSKRYEHERDARFVRKIYVGKSRQSKHLQSCCSLAVITYYWKGGIPENNDDPIDSVADVARMGNSQARTKRVSDV